MTVAQEVPARPGDVLDLRVGEVAAGGWCVARLVLGDDPEERDGGLVVFVRHALPGELVKAVVTQRTSQFARADAVEIVRGSADRVRPPCPYARPGGCGGCDWQHASLPAQRALKAQVVSQQLRRIAGIDRTVTVEALPGETGGTGGTGGLGWRTRVRFAVDSDGQAGLRKHRSNEIVAIGDCLIAHPVVAQAEVTRRRWPGVSSVEVAASPPSGQRAVIVRRALTVQQHRRAGASSQFLTQHAAGRDWRVSAAGFWQVHPEAADKLAAEVLAALEPRPGETALDLFCGAGLFAGVLAQAVGPSGQVIGVEEDQAAVADARHNLRRTPWARVHRGDAAEVIGRIGLSGASVAVLDPPRSGAGGALAGILCAAPGLRRIAYVSCDPATLARDLSAFARRQWRLAGLRAFDAFPMTHHVECLAILEPPAG